MRVLILSPDIYTLGGIARYTAALASALGEMVGSENVHVLPLQGRGESPANLPGCRVLQPVTRRLTTISKFRFVFRALRLGRDKYNLAICTHIGLSPVAALLQMVFGTPFWVTCHGRESWSRFPADVRWALSRANLLLPVSRFTAEMVAKVNGIPQSKMCALHNAIPDAFATRLASSDGSNGSAAASGGRDRYILSVGTVARKSAYKGFDTVIKALPRVLEAVPSVRYVVVGEGDDIDRLKGLAREVDVQDKVEFKGGIPDAGLAECYRACEVFVLPSRAGSPNGKSWQGEGFGRVYVEASLAGKPVVGSIGGGAAEAVLHQKTGLLVSPESVPDIADAIIRLLQDPEKAAWMGQEGKRWALGNFTSRALRRQLTELLYSKGFSFRSRTLAGAGSGICYARKTTRHKRQLGFAGHEDCD